MATTGTMTDIANNQLQMEARKKASNRITANTPTSTKIAISIPGIVICMSRTLTPACNADNHFNEFIARQQHFGSLAIPAVRQISQP
jgi:hypothetical protein